MSRFAILKAIDAADRALELELEPIEHASLVTALRFVAVLDRESVVTAATGKPTEAVLEALGPRARSGLADQMRLVADALDPPGLVERLASDGALELDPLGPLG